MLCAVNWLLSLKTAPPLLLDGVSVHPLVGHAFVDRTLDALDSADVGDLVLLDVAATGLGRVRATVANLGAAPRLLLQGDEIQHGDDEFELAAPLLLAPDGAARVELRRVVGGEAPSPRVQQRLHRLEQFELPLGTVGYLAIQGDELVRAELFAGPLTCRQRWGWAVGSVLSQADVRQRPILGAAAATELLGRLTAACRSGSWVEEAASVWRLQARQWPSLVGRVILAGGRPVYLDLASLEGSLPVAPAEPLPVRPLAAAVALDA